MGAAHACATIASRADLGTPLAHNVSLPDTLPSIKLDSIQGAIEGNTTLRLSGDPLEGISALQVFPATLFLCRSFGCVSGCFTFDLRALQQGVCLRTDFGFNSVGILQPSDVGLPFGVFVGPPGCRAFDKLPFLNACFDVNAGPYTQVFLNP